MTHAQLSSLDRPPAFVLNLEKVPAAMVYQVLNDLPIIKVLQILHFGKRSLKICVYTHRIYEKMFISPDDTAPVLDLFKLYRDVHLFKGLPLAPQGHYISNVHNHYEQPWNPKDYYLTEIKQSLTLPILDAVRLSALDEELLSKVSHNRCPALDENDLSSIKARWEWIKKNIFRLNAAKSRQLGEVAQLIAENPGRVRLKKPLDPLQGEPRPNTEHIVARFQGDARRILKNRYVNKHRSHCFKAVDNIEVVPHDKYLWLFFDTIKRFPPADDQATASSIEGSSEDSRLGKPASLSASLTNVYGTHAANVSPNISSAHKNQSHPEILGETKFSYPADIAFAIGIVMRGLVNVYTGSPLLIVPRIDWSPTASASSNPAKPIFHINNEPHPPDLPNKLHRCHARKVMPYDEREYKWIKTFLKVVTWMEDNLSDKEQQFTEK